MFILHKQLILKRLRLCITNSCHQHMIRTFIKSSSFQTPPVPSANDRSSNVYPIRSESIWPVDEINPHHEQVVAADHVHILVLSHSLTSITKKTYTHTHSQIHAWQRTDQRNNCAWERRNNATPPGEKRVLAPISKADLSPAWTMCLSYTCRPPSKKRRKKKTRWQTTIYHSFHLRSAAVRCRVCVWSTSIYSSPVQRLSCVIERWRWTLGSA